MEQIAQALSREGSAPYIIYNGASSARGALGYVEAAAEIWEQISSNAESAAIRNVCIPRRKRRSCRRLYLRHRTPGKSVPCGASSRSSMRAEPLREIINGFLKDLEELCGVPMPCLLEETATLHGAYRFGGWGIITPEVEVLQEGIFIEKVYTSRRCMACVTLRRRAISMTEPAICTPAASALFCQYHIPGGGV